MVIRDTQSTIHHDTLLYITGLTAMIGATCVHIIDIISDWAKCPQRWRNDSSIFTHEDWYCMCLRSQFDTECNDPILLMDRANPSLLCSVKAGKASKAVQPCMQKGRSHLFISTCRLHYVEKECAVVELKAKWFGLFTMHISKQHYPGYVLVSGALKHPSNRQQSMSLHFLAGTVGLLLWYAWGKCGETYFAHAIDGHNTTNSSVSSKLSLE